MLSSLRQPTLCLRAFAPLCLLLKKITHAENAKPAEEFVFFPCSLINRKMLSSLQQLTLCLRAFAPLCLRASC